MAEPELSEVERIKAASRRLRGTLEESLADPLSGAIAEDDTQLSKFHGIYQQDDRDLRTERRKQMLEPDYSFMIRARVPGGVCTPAQWLALDEIARRYANGTLRLTTRQAFQLHGVIKRELRETIRAINASLLDTLAACGDVNRNVMASINPHRSRLHRRVAELAAEVSAHLTPRTRAYHEIWLDGERVTPADEGRPEEEPIYGDTYLPRKFKMGIVVPPENDIDVFSQDLGFIAVVEDGELAGFNVVVGGGMGTTHGDPETYARLGDVIGRCAPQELVGVSEQVVRIQRDYGDRSNRKHARLKYTIADRGVDWFREELAKRRGRELAPAAPFELTHTGDRYGWIEGEDGHWHYTLFIENGRIADRGGLEMMSALREIAARHRGEFRLTPNQNLTIADVAPADKDGIDALLGKYGLGKSRRHSPMRLHSMACVGFPTCGLAMAESERYLPSLMRELEALAERHGIADEPIVVRMTGCPNGCARPFLAEIGLVGKAPGRYNLHIGAAFEGTRLNAMYRENVGEKEILAALDELFGRYAAEREPGERFGDFTVRTGVVEIASPAAA